MPAPTVSLESSSTRMNAPVVRFSPYGSATIGALVRSVSRAMSLSSSWSGGVSSRSVVTSSSTSIESTAARTVRVVCLSATCSPARSGLSDIQQTVASMWRPATGRSSTPKIISPRPTSRSSASCTVTESGGDGGFERPVERLDRQHLRPRRRRAGSSPRRRGAACRRRPGPRSGARAVRPPRAGSPTGPAAGAGPRRGRRRRRPARGSVSSGGPSYQSALPGSTTLSPWSAEIGNDLRVLDAELRRERAELAPRSRGSGPRPSRRGPSC